MGGFCSEQGGPQVRARGLTRGPGLRASLQRSSNRAWSPGMRALGVTQRTGPHSHAGHILTRAGLRASRDRLLLPDEETDRGQTAASPGGQPPPVGRAPNGGRGLMGWILGRGTRHCRPATRPPRAVGMTAAGQPPQSPKACSVPAQSEPLPSRHLREAETVSPNCRFCKLDSKDRCSECRKNTVK